MNVRLLILVLSLNASSAVAFCENPVTSWSITSYDTVPRAPGSGLYSTTVKYRANNEGPAIRKDLAITIVGRLKQVKNATVIGHTALLLGTNGYFDDAVIVDLEKGTVVDQIMGYYPALLNDRWIVWVEFYPNHVYGATPRDVVLVYDLTKSSAQNRLRDKSSSPVARSEIEIGIPVFPEVNTHPATYQNISDDNAQAWKVLPNTFGLAPDGALIFAAARGEAFDEQVRFLVHIDLPRAGAEPIIKMAAISTQSLGIQAGDNGPVQIKSVHILEDGRVSIEFPKGAYSIDHTIVSLSELNFGTVH